ncbi:MAG TPA: hypothetical protein VEC18_08855 [Myxococcota bacterium]|nr:hypothetical protein [Myxococcota bacterium]
MKRARTSLAPRSDRLPIAPITACATALALAVGASAPASSSATPTDSDDAPSSSSAIPASAVDAPASARSLPVDCDAARAACDEAVEALVRRWFDALSGPAGEPSALGALLAAGPLEISLDGNRLADRAALIAWASALRDRYARIEFELDEIEVEPQRDRSRRVRVEFDRRALDREGYTHLVRREQTWRVELEPGGTPVVRGIDERQLLPFPGTGPGVLGF